MLPHHPRRGAAGQQYAIIVGLVGVVALLSVNILGNNVRNMFVNTGNVMGTVTNTGGVSSPPPPPPPPDTTPDAFNFSDITGASAATQIESAILQINGHVGVTVSISGGGSPQFRICSDATCSSVVQAYGSASQTIANGQYLQLRLTSSSAANTQLTATVTVGTASDSWAVTTANELYSFSSHTFTNCGATGRNGPAVSTCATNYGTSWSSNSSYFTQGSYQGYQLWTVPVTATYRITAAGARGGYGYNGTSYYGQGRIVRGDIALTQGQKLTIVVGQQGQDRDPSSTYGGGGGGGSFVALGDNASSAVIQLVGGGGGGANAYSNYGFCGRYSQSDSHGRTDNSGDVSQTWAGSGYYGDGASITSWGRTPYGSTSHRVCYVFAQPMFL